MGRILILLLVLPSCHAGWDDLQRYQHTITRQQFDRLIATVYCPSGAFTNYLTYTADTVTIHSTPAKTNTLFTLRFAPSTISHQPSPLRRIVLDPGHIGGRYARIEERSFRLGRDRPVQEAALNLTVARLLKSRLESTGFTVFLTKNDLHPVTDKRPKDFPQPIQFYRQAEIAARAQLINSKLKPDLTICLHFNAVEWNDRQDLVDDNRLTVFIHGNYLPAEITDDEQKLRLLTKLLDRSYEKELPAAEALASTLAKATTLPPLPASMNAIPAIRNPYILVRNLAANRLFDGPVVFLEPYYMNNRIVYQRIQAGDYTGEREIAGKRYRSIFREYADSVAEALMKLSGETAPATGGSERRK